MQRMWKHLRMIGISCLVFFATTAAPLAAQVQWQSWSAAVELQQQNQQPILLFVYTDWCALCKRTTSQCWEEPALAAFINEHFIPVRFDAESTEPITYQGKTYQYVRENNMGYHAFVAHLMEG
ncbi:MAG: thioredoxin family protein, partial [Lewinella sp.]|nr:thioredoxin family protein [Lewinella sp.]